MRNKLLICGAAFAVLLCPPLTVSAAAVSMWSITYGGAAGFDGFSLVPTSDGGYAVVGTANTPDGSFIGNTDFWLFKIDASGNMEWNKTYGNPGTAYENGRTVIVTPDGGYLLCGFAATWPDTWLYYVDSHSWVVKTDASGNMQWNRTYGGTYAFSMVAAPDGGYAIALDNMLVKTDAAGNMQWNKSYSGYLVVTPDGGYAMAGGAGLIKTDVQGNVQWNQTYGGTAYFSAKALVLTPDGGYAMVGQTYSTVNGLNNWAYCLVKTDALGNQQWIRTYNSGRTDDWPYSLIVTPDGGYAIAGSSENIGNTIDWYYWLVKTDASGDMQWGQTYASSGLDWARSVVRASDGGYLISGMVSGGSCWLVKTDENGIVPEYSSLLASSLLLTATAFVVVNKKRLLHRR